MSRRPDASLNSRFANDRNSKQNVLQSDGLDRASVLQPAPAPDLDNAAELGDPSQHADQAANDDAGHAGVCDTLHNKR